MSVCCISGIVVFVLFVSKNLILTGYPLFPAPFFKDLFAMDYAVPDTIYNFWFNTAKLYDFMLTQEEYHHAGVFKIFLRWLLYSKMGSVFNGLILLLLIVTPYFLSRFCNKKPYWILYFAMLLQTVFFFGTSPQYRFMLHYMLFFMMLVVSFFMNRKMISLLPFATLPIIFLLQAFPLKNKTAGMAFQYNTEAFSFNNIIVPCSNSNLKTSYCKIALGNLQYYSPDHHVYIWAIGDAPLPGLNAKQLNYFENKLQYIPQQRTGNLTDGFYSLKISNK